MPDGPVSNPADTSDEYPVTIDSAGKPSYARGARRPWWMIIAVPFIVLMIFLKNHVKNICWKSTLLLVLLFEFTLLFVEHNSVMIGHWVYNKNAIVGIEIWEIPIEEPLIYYLFPPVFVVMIFHLFVSHFERKRQ
ncbi:MAG: hypothetical protein GF350_17475 [Chitinivibrionales bacterium]|nr:hypothetical protein [Chitinivibrionales bacterium]